MRTWPWLLAVGGHRRSVPWETVVVLGSAALSLGLVMARWLRWPRSSPRPPLDQEVGPANFRFSQSWASTVTGVGAFLTAVAASDVLPHEGRYMSLSGFVVLTLLFGFLVVLAPFVYAATSSPVGGGSGPPLPPGMPPLAAGRVWAFLLTTVVTLWAVFGQLATMGFAAAELTKLTTAFYVFLAVLVAVTGLMVRYSWQTIRWVLEVQAAHEARAKSLMAAEPVPRPGWTLL